MSTELQFDPASHAYSVDGQLVPSVTQALSILSDFSSVDPDLLKRAAHFGTHVHQACDLWNRGVLDLAALDPELRPYLDAWRNWLDVSGAVVISSEQRVFHSMHRYAGTLDAVVEIGGRQAVVDIKTGQLPKTVGPQLAAYAEALNHTAGKRVIKRRLAIQLTADGFKSHELKGNADWPVFLSALNCWRFLNA